MQAHCLHWLSRGCEHRPFSQCLPHSCWDLCTRLSLSSVNFPVVELSPDLGFQSDSGLVHQVCLPELRVLSPMCHVYTG